MPKPVARRRCMLDKNVLTIGLDADHTLCVKGAPCSIALLCLAEIPAANDIGLCSRRAGSLDFLAIARVKLDGAHHTISFVKLHADDAAASVFDELEDEGGFVHGKKQRGASRPVKEEYQQTARKRGLAAPASHFVTNQPVPSMQFIFKEFRMVPPVPRPQACCHLPQVTSVKAKYRSGYY